MLNQRLGKRGTEYLVTTPFYIQWIRLGEANRYDRSLLAVDPIKVAIPNPVIVRREDLPPEHTVVGVGNAWKYVGVPLNLQD